MMQGNEWKRKRKHGGEKERHGGKGLSQMKKQTSLESASIKQMEKNNSTCADAGLHGSARVLDALAKAKTAVSAIENAADMVWPQTAMEGTAAHRRDGHTYRALEYACKFSEDFETGEQNFGQTPVGSF